MTIFQSRRYAKHIQKKWRLTDWKLEVKHDDSLAANGEEGCIEWNTDYKTATITLVSESRSEKQIKETIRHELLHLLLEGHKDCRERDPMFEFGLNLISEITG
jgi:hypothetical protein